ncbi:hypothetical protein SCALM49S_08933 [Streptomyces californicus]
MRAAENPNGKDGTVPERNPETDVIAFRAAEQLLDAQDRGAVADYLDSVIAAHPENTAARLLRARALLAAAQLRPADWSSSWSWSANRTTRSPTSRWPAPSNAPATRSGRPGTSAWRPPARPGAGVPARGEVRRAALNGPGRAPGVRAGERRRSGTVSPRARADAVGRGPAGVRRNLPARLVAQALAHPVRDHAEVRHRDQRRHPARRRPAGSAVHREGHQAEGARACPTGSGRPHPQRTVGGDRFTAGTHGDHLAPRR